MQFAGDKAAGALHEDTIGCVVGNGIGNIQRPRGPIDSAKVCC